MLAALSREFPALLLGALLSSAIAQNDSASDTVPPPFKNVLIVKNDTYLENAVSKIIADSLAQKGFTVKIVSLESLKDEQPGAYGASIIFSAIRSSKMSPIVRSYARALGATQSNIMVCTVYGGQWMSDQTKADAVAAATKTLNPAEVAGRIIHRFESFPHVR